MADGLGEEHSAEVQKIVDKVFKLYALMAQQEWLPWGGELLFSDLQKAVKHEVQEAEARQQMEEEAGEIA
jgi:hypothetical protein